MLNKKVLNCLAKLEANATITRNIEPVIADESYLLSLASIPPVFHCIPQLGGFYLVQTLEEHRQVCLYLALCSIVDFCFLLRKAFKFKSSYNQGHSLHISQIFRSNTKIN